MASCVTPAWVVMTLSAPYGSVTTAMSVRRPLRSMCTVPTPPWSSPTTQAMTRSPASRTPERRMASAAMIMAASPPFML